MSTDRPGHAARLPHRVVAGLLALTTVLLTLAFTDGARLVPAGQASSPDAPAAPAASFEPYDSHPHTDEAYSGSGTLLLRSLRDAGERTAPSGHLLFTPPYTPRVPHGPVRPAPVAGHGPLVAAYVPSDLGRAPPSSTSA
ncbi:hypothetical protein ACFTXK_21940 [Streptomyces sp. NPDC056956]|uniref:hypothetical protein n=1 Tax=Streptomyces sp. NPDC056956 TaxID=3345980 RepID=UPI003638ABE8